MSSETADIVEIVDIALAHGRPVTDAENSSAFDGGEEAASPCARAEQTGRCRWQLTSKLTGSSAIRTVRSLTTGGTAVGDIAAPARLATILVRLRG
jgi:hypothetical protein